MRTLTYFLSSFFGSLATSALVVEDLETLPTTKMLAALICAAALGFGAIKALYDDKQTNKDK